jgi:hypothetical protein
MDVERIGPRLSLLLLNLFLDVDAAVFSAHIDIVGSNCLLCRHCQFLQFRLKSNCVKMPTPQMTRAYAGRLSRRLTARFLSSHPIPVLIELGICTTRPDNICEPLHAPGLFLLSQFFHGVFQAVASDF